MKRPILALLLSAGVLAAMGMAARPAQPPQKPVEKSAGPERYQLVLLKLGPAWQKGKPLVQQPGIQEHRDYMMKLIKQGTLVLGGPLVDDKNQVFTGAMMVLALGTAEEARQALAADPATKSEIWQVDKIETMIITGTSWKPTVPKE